MRSDIPTPIVTLEALTEGCSARVVALECDQALKRRLMSLGIRRNTDLRVLKRAGRGGAILEIGFGHIAAGPKVLRAVRVATTRSGRTER